MEPYFNFTSVIIDADNYWVSGYNLPVLVTNTRHIQLRLFSPSLGHFLHPDPYEKNSNYINITVWKKKKKPASWTLRAYYQSTVCFPLGKQFILGTILGAVPGRWMVLCTTQLRYTTQLRFSTVSPGKLHSIEPLFTSASQGPCGLVSQSDSVNWALQLCPSPHLDIDRNHPFLFNWVVREMWKADEKYLLEFSKSAGLDFLLCDSHTSLHTALLHCWWLGSFAC